MSVFRSPSRLTMPDVIRRLDIAGAPMHYPWDLDESDAIAYPRDDEHKRLRNAIWQCSLRCAFGVLLSTAEWVVWRFEGLVELSDPLLRIEAGYVALVAARYANLPEPPDDFPDDMQDAHGPLMLARMLIASGYAAYAANDKGVYENALSMALLARHVAPKRKPFDAWLSATLRRAHVRYPRLEEPIGDQQAIPRTFFFDESGREWSDAEVHEALAAELARLDPAANPFLRDVESLRAKG
jgi:hypothetical protein